MVADGVVTTLTFGQRAYAPAGEEPRSHEVACDGLRFRLVDDATPEQVSVVRAQRVDFVAVGVQCQGVVLAILDPEVAVKATLEVGRLSLELFGECRIVPNEARQTGSAHLCVVGISLELAGRSRKTG